MPVPGSDSAAGAHGGRVAGPYLQPLLEAAAARGVAPRELARGADLAPETLTPLPESLSTPDYLRLLDAGARLAADPYFGLHVGERVKLGAYHVYGLILLSCGDVGQALQQTMRFESLAHDLGRSALHVQGGVAEYRWQSALPHASRHLAESVFAGIYVFGNWLAGRPLPAAHIAFMHDAPEDSREHVRIFGARPEFSAEAHYAHFDAALLAWSLPNADVGMHPVLQRHAERLLQERQKAVREGDIVARVRSLIVRNLAQERVRLAQVVQDLNVTQRTLQRKLSEAGISFQQVLDQTRCDLARDYLQEDNLGIAEIAFLLGYREQSSFNHAFKEWTGVNPGVYRARTRG